MLDVPVATSVAAEFARGKARPGGQRGSFACCVLRCNRGEIRSHCARHPGHARHEQQWEKAIAGHAVKEFKVYNVGASFNEGDLLRHKKFGDGVVTRVIDGHKVEVLFRDEARTLAQAMA